MITFFTTALRRKTFKNGSKILCILSTLIIIACDGGGGPTSPSRTITFAGTSSPGIDAVYTAKNNALSSGDILAIDVKMNNLSSNVYGAAFDVDFDSTKITFDSYVAGSFLESGGNTVNYHMGLQSGNNGKLVVGISRQGSVSGVSGSGTIVTLKFKVTGNSSVAFSNYELRDSNNLPISGINWYGGSITIQ